MSAKKLLISPHNLGDDEALFASFICLRERPKVVVCFDGRRKKDYPSAAERAAESASAMAILGCEFEHLGFICDPPDWDALEQRLAEYDPETVWVPLPEPHGNRGHNGVSEIAIRLWPGRVAFYATYHMIDEHPIKSTNGDPVSTEPGWDDLKRAALACYPTQSSRPGTAMHFTRPLDEYEVPAPTRLNLASGPNPIRGMVNLDKADGWLFEDGLGGWADGSVEAITISHALMYVHPNQWRRCFAEFARVLQPDGILRVTEDAIGAPGSGRPVIRPRAQVATTATMILDHMTEAGLAARLVAPDETGYRDGSLIQQNYGDPPDVFHAEAIKRV